MGVQTITNGSIGLGLQWCARSRVLESLTAEVTALGCWQQSGQLWPFDAGAGASASLSVEFQKNFRLFGQIFYARDFVSLYGIPFYSTISHKQPGARLSYVLTPHIGAEWSHTFAKNYILGAKVDAYPMIEGELTNADGSVRSSAFFNNFSFGIYFRCHPRFLLVNYNKKRSDSYK